MVSSPKIEFDSESGFVYRYRERTGNNKSSIILLHGRGGDEDAMWILEHALPKGGLIVAPRALYPMDENSYSWVRQSLKGWPTVEDFQPSISSLMNFVEGLETRFGLRREEVLLVGFSQGAALAFAAATVPDFRPRAIIAAAGFLPKGNFVSLEGLPVFWGHGSKDEWIPIERARSDAILLRDFGVKIQFCETDVGHKLGTECLDGLKGWIDQVLN